MGSFGQISHPLKYIVPYHPPSPSQFFKRIHFFCKSRTLTPENEVRTDLTNVHSYVKFLFRNTNSIPIASNCRYIISQIPNFWREQLLLKGFLSFLLFSLFFTGNLMNRKITTDGIELRDATAQCIVVQLVPICLPSRIIGIRVCVVWQ